MRFKKNRYRNLSNELSESLSDSEVDVLFKESGITFTALYYNLVRILIAFLVSVFSLYSDLKLGNSDMLRNIILLVVFITATTPKVDFFGKKTPFGFAMKLIRAEFDAKKDFEIYRAITQLKNLAIAQQGKPLGADFIISQLMKFTNVTKPIFANTLKFWRLGKENEAYEYFVATSNTKLGKDFAGILVKLDRMNPVELVEQLVSFQTGVREVKLTKQLDRQETQSNIIFVPIIASAFAVMLNFIAIVLWIDAFESIMLL